MNDIVTLYEAAANYRQLAEGTANPARRDAYLDGLLERKAASVAPG